MSPVRLCVLSTLCIKTPRIYSEHNWFLWGQTLQLSYEEAGAARIATEAVEDLKALPGAEGLGSVVAECEEELAGLLKLHQSVLREFSCVVRVPRTQNEGVLGLGDGVFSGVRVRVEA